MPSTTLGISLALLPLGLHWISRVSLHNKTSLVSRAHVEQGRRMGMFLGSSIVIVATIIQASCVDLAGFMVGRFILGFGVALCASAGPAYVSEMSHPAWRGTMTAVYNTFWWMGGQWRST